MGCEEFSGDRLGDSVPLVDLESRPRSRKTELFYNGCSPSNRRGIRYDVSNGLHIARSSFALVWISSFGDEASSSASGSIPAGILFLSL